MLKLVAKKSLFMVIAFSMMALFLSACSSQNQSGLVDQSPTSRELPKPTLTPIPTLPPFDATILIFEEGKYIRDEYCARIFNYQKTTFGELSIGIEDSLTELSEPQELAETIIDRYINLYNNSPVPMSLPLNVYIISDTDIGECYSKDNLVFAAPDEIDSKSFIEDVLEVGTGINEYWIVTGLTSLILGEEPDSEALKTWYQNTEDLDIAGLFFARFHEDWTTEEERQIAHMSATSLVKYALEVENIQPDMLVEQINNNVRTHWLESLGVNRTVTYPYDGHFKGFAYSQSSECPLIVEADRMLFCLNRLPDQEYFDEIPEAEFLIDHAYYGRKALEEYLLSEAPSVNQYMDLEETIFFEVMEL